jgi:hypothetical protein
MSSRSMGVTNVRLRSATTSLVRASPACSFSLTTRTNASVSFGKSSSSRARASAVPTAFAEAALKRRLNSLFCGFSVRRANESPFRPSLPTRRGETASGSVGSPRSSHFRTPGHSCSSRIRHHAVQLHSHDVATGRVKARPARRPGSQRDHRHSIRCRGGGPRRAYTVPPAAGSCDELCVILCRRIGARGFATSTLARAARRSEPPRAPRRCEACAPSCGRRRRSRRAPFDRA